MHREVAVHMGQAPLNPSEIYEEATKTYLQALLPFARFAGLTAIAVNVFFFYTPAPLVLNVTWSVLISLFSVTMLASMAILPMAVELRAGGGANASTGIRGIQQHGVRFLLATGVFAIFGGLLILTWIGILLVSFLAVRLSLFGPAIVLEESDVTDAYSRSWELVGKLWARTAGILLGAIAPFAAFAILLALIGAPSGVAIFLLTFAEALIAPFVALVVLLLFEDYRRIEEARPKDFREPPPSVGL